jgi:4-aminobutyrate aminotransferase-like enzyme
LGSKRSYDPIGDLVFVRSQGEKVWDQQGNEYLDMICGYSACNLGHAHPRITAAACDQLAKLTWAHGGASLERKRLEVTLAELWDSNRISSPSSPRHTKVWLTVSGARAIEIAWKIAHAKNPGVAVRFDIAYHGRSLATALLSDTQRSKVLSEDVSCTRVRTIRFPKHIRGVCGPIYATSSPSSLCPECLECLDQAEEVFEQMPSGSSILFVEPAIGARGYYFAPAAFLQRLVASARQRGLTVICDEIQMGLRRTGAMFMCRAQGWEPDLLVLGKSLGGGIVPIAAVLGDANLVDAVPAGIESETFAAYPLACRIAQESLGILSEPKLGEDVERKGELFRTLMRDELPGNLVVDGAGLASCVSLENLPGAGVAQATEVVGWLSKHGILVHLTGPRRNRLAMIPSLLIPDEALELAARKIIQALSAIDLA